MLRGATALLAWRQAMFVNSPDGVVEAFRKEFYATQLFFDPFAGGKFAQYFFRAHERAAEERTAESATRLIEEAQLFIEACHGCTIREAARLQTAKV
jgi:sulfite reductase (ferredoxin)